MGAQVLQIALPLVGVPCMTLTTTIRGMHPLGVQLVAAKYRESDLFIFKDSCSMKQLHRKQQFRGNTLKGGTFGGLCLSLCYVR